MQPAQFEAICLPRNGRGYLIDHFVFIKKDERPDKQLLRLRCKEHGRENCPAYAKIEKGQCYLSDVEHSHTPPSNLKHKFREEILDDCRSASTSRISIRQVYEQKRDLYKNAAPCTASREKVISDLPDFDAVRTSMGRARNELLPTAPQSSDEVDAAHVKNAFLIDSQEFLLEDSGPNDPSRLMIFGNPKVLKERVPVTPHFYLDGTFWVTPRLFYQMVTLHCLILGQMFPILYAVLPGKSEDIYAKFFAMLHCIFERFGILYAPSVTFISDFEPGLISCISNVFGQGNFSHRGCFFHFCQAIYKNLGQNTTRYLNIPEFRKAVRMLMALGFVPSADKLKYYYGLLSLYSHDHHFVDFAGGYFMRQWIVRTPMCLWDWYLVPVRTNNYVEGFHSGLKKFFEQPHLSFYKFLGHLCRHASQTANKIIGRVQGQALPRTNVVVVKRHAVVMGIMNEYQLRSILIT